MPQNWKLIRKIGLKNNRLYNPGGNWPTYRRPKK